jgi:hypothetical protein
MSANHARWWSIVTACIAMTVVVAAPAPAPAAMVSGPGWAISGTTLPTFIPPHGRGTVALKVFNVGAGGSRGRVTVTDSLPAGLTALEAGEAISLSSDSGTGASPKIGHEYWECAGDGPGGTVAGATVVTCTNSPTNLPSLPGGGGSPHQTNLGSSNQLPIVAILVEAAGESGPALDHATVVGGGAPAPANTEFPVTVSTVTPPFGFTNWNTWLSNADGTMDTQAGSHPYEAVFSFDLARALTPSEGGSHVAGGEARDIEVELPTGLVGNPSVVAQCTRAQLAVEECPIESQVGTVTAYFAQFGVAGFRLFNMVPAPGSPAQLAFNFEGIQSILETSARTGSDYGISTRIANAAQREVIGSVVTLWGVPGEASHDIWRNGIPAGCTPEQLERPSLCTTASKPIQKPFLTMPTACGPADLFSISTNTWQNASLTSSAVSELTDPSGNPTPITGCGKLSFQPAFSAAPEVATADTPTGLSTAVKPSLGGLEEPGQLASSNLKRAHVVLPAGMTVNPGQASGLQACQENAAQSAIGTEGPANCPAASKIGTVSIRSPLIETAGEKEFQGNVYILQSNPPQLHILVAASADGVNLKLVGIVHLDPQTGRLTATFGEDPAVEAEDPFLAGHLALPDLPASEFKLTFDGGPKAALVSPARCGEYATAADFTPWASPSIPDVDQNPAFKVTAGAAGAPCPAAGPLPFTPSLVAGTTNPVGGASSSFVLKVSEPDDQQNITAIDATLPPGQLAKLAGVALCPEAAAPSGNCPASSQVGSVAAAVGPGANPLQVPQPGKAPTAAYLAGPYKGAPYSLVTKVPAQAGPFDLGTVVTRVALQVNEMTTQVTAKSDPLPQILDGVPLDYQDIIVSVDRPDFIRNPTDCEPMKVTARVSGSEGAAADISNRYQIGDCASLAFKPPLKLILAGQTRRLGHPALKAVLTYPKGDNANVARAQVNLPHSEFLDQGNLNKTCTRPVLLAGRCPKSSIYGKAKAWTPLLERPLEGPVYLVGGFGYKLPALVAELNGQLRVLLVGKVDSGKNKGIRNTFEAVPDAPVSRFVLELKGGRKYGLLENSEDICKNRQKAISRFTGQNGKTYDTEPVIQVSCGKKGKSKKQRKGSKKG